MQVTTNPDDMMWADDLQRWQRVPVVIINGDDDDDDKPQWRRRRTMMITTTSYSPQRTMIIFRDDEIFRHARIIQARTARRQTPKQRDKESAAVSSLPYILLKARDRCWPIRRPLARAVRVKPRIVIKINLKGSEDNARTRGPTPLMTNRKSHMSFRLVPNSVTLDDLKRRNSANPCVISPYSVAFRTDYVKMVKDTVILSAAEM